jgi:predicted enzyme related to lactoylglutathione lyase
MGTQTLITRLNQVALSVHDMDRAVTFYRDVVGLHFLFRAPNVAFFGLAGLRLMLGQAEPPELKPAGTVLYFDVADLDASFAQLSQRGAVAQSAPHRVARLGDRDLWMAFFHDPDGNMFALTAERPAAG